MSRAAVNETAIEYELKKGPVFTPEIDAILSELGLVTDRVDVTQAPEALLKDPDWERMAALAARRAIAQGARVGAITPFGEVRGDEYPKCMQK